MHLTVPCLTVHVGYKREKRHHNYYTESVIPFAILFSEHIPQGESEMDQGGSAGPPVASGLKASCLECLMY